MKRFILLFLFFYLSVLTAAHSMSAGDVLLVDDFNARKFINKRGGTVGTWKRDPKDTSQWCEISFDDGTFVGLDGSSLKVDYNIASYMTTYVNPEKTRISSQEVGFHMEGFNGVYSHLRNLDATRFKYLVFSARGDDIKGFTRKFKIDIRDKKRTTSVYVEGLTARWRRYFIPLDKLLAPLNIKELQEIVIVFDQGVTVPYGVIYLDEIYFASGRIDLEDYQAFIKSQEAEKRALDELPRPPAEAEDNAQAVRMNIQENQLREAELKAIEESAKQGQLEVRRENEFVIITTRILFPYDQYVIPAGEMESVKKVSEIIKEHPNFFVRVNGHTDNSGGEKYNFLLSLRRANAVKESLVHDFGIGAELLSVYGWGLNAPVDTNLTEEGKAKNRRVEFVFSSDPNTPAYPSMNPMQVDGAPKDWIFPSNFTLTSEKQLERGTPVSAQDISSEVSFQWDDRFLYLYVRVYDNERVCLKTGRNIFLTDSIELFIDPDGDGFFWGNPKDFQIGFSPTSPVSEPQVWAWFQNKRPTKEQVQFTSQLFNDGYAIEAAISWKFLSESLAQSIETRREVPSASQLKMGVSLAVHDVDLQDETRETKLNWNFKKDETKQDLFKLGSLLLFEVTPK